MAIITSGIYSTEDVKALQEISNILPHSYLQKQRHKKWEELLKPTLAVLWNKKSDPHWSSLVSFFQNIGEYLSTYVGFLGKIKGKASGRALVFGS